MGSKKRGAPGGRGGGTKRGRPAKQTKLTDSTDGFLPEIKDPKSVIGVQIEIPGSFWSEFCKSLTATEKSTMFKCTVRAFDAAHDFSQDEARWAYRAKAPKGRAFQVHECGPDGKGSLELDDSSGAVFWLPYREFQKYYYLTFPDKKSPSSSQQAASGITSPDACTPSPPAGMHPQFPNLKVSTATVFAFFDVVADTRITDQTHARCGSFMAELTCTIVPAGGGAACGRLRKVIHADQKGISTSNLISHLEEGSKTCQAHAAALDDVRKNSKGYCVTAAGELVPKFSFNESFQHHINLCYCLCDGLSQHIAKGPSFRDYVCALNPRVTIPCNESIHRLLHCIALLQKEERLSRYAALRRELKSEFLGLQLDGWWNPADKSSYACITVTTICEPKRDEPQRLNRRSEVISFAVFPERKFAENIRDWVQRELAANNIVADDISGITPDGASDGQAGLRLIDALAQKVDTCHLHQLQSAIKWALGLSGQPCQNKAAKKLIQVNARIPALANKSQPFYKAIVQAQLDAGVPLRSIIRPRNDSETRWGGLKELADVNGVLRPAVVPAVEQYKIDHRNEKDAITETVEDGATKEMKAVAAKDIGLSSDEYRQTAELVGLLEPAFALKECFEHKALTGASSLILLYRLKMMCDTKKHLFVKPSPKTASLADRHREGVKTSFTELDPLVQTAAEILGRELQQRLFDFRSSNSRCVELRMSKQGDVMSSKSSMLTPEQKQFCETAYLQALRLAESQGLGKKKPEVRTSPRKALASHQRSGGKLFEDDDDDTEQAEEITSDAVMLEVGEWSRISKANYQQFMLESGVFDEFAFMWHMRERFPLHYAVFRRTASHLPHEGNVEQVFSRAGFLADPASGTEYFSNLVMCGMNKKAWKPTHAAVEKKYFELYRGNRTRIEAEQDFEDVTDTVEEA